ncbi:hypothetical protein ERJ75_001841800 [Trypanosoma vivax]|nr:hypothetical protein ERJ75_001841800 [Trypanosoma vivax]
MRNFRHRLENTERVRTTQAAKQRPARMCKGTQRIFSGNGFRANAHSSAGKGSAANEAPAQENEGPKIQLARETGRDLRRRITASWNALAEVGWGDRQDRKTERGHTRKRMECLARVAALVADAGGTLLETRRAKAGETRGRNGLERTQVARPAKGKGIDGQHLREESEAKEGRRAVA